MTKTERNRKILSLRDKGHSFKEIAAFLGTTVGTVAGVCARNGRTNPLAKGIRPIDHLEIFNRMKRGESAASIAIRFGASRNRIIGIYQRHIPAIEADNRDLKICSLIDEGFDNQAISRILNLHRKTISTMRNALEKTV
jgi:DNA-binding NarL/FixJ family response regulator